MHAIDAGPRPQWHSAIVASGGAACARTNGLKEPKESPANLIVARPLVVSFKARVESVLIKQRA